MSVRKFRPSILEIVFWIGGLCGIVAVTLAYIVPLRTAGTEIGGFPARSMYLTKMTGFSGNTQPYSWYSEETCRHYRVSVGQLSDPVTAASNEAIGNASPTKFCSMYRGCRDIEAIRCVWYKKVGEGGDMGGILMIAGLCLYLVGCVLVVFRLNPRIIAAVGIVGGFTLTYGFLHWVQLSDALLNFQRTMVFVPYAKLSGGSMAIFAMAGLMTLAPLSTVRMVDHYKEAPDVPDEPDTQAGEAEAEDEE